jgi:KDO2-lipid IV(A) lauroyltransferase
MMAKHLPAGFIYGVSRGLSALGFYFMKKRTHTAIQNIRSVYGMDETKARAFAKEVYRQLSETIAEMLLMVVDRFEVDDAIVNLQEAAQQLKALSDRSENGIVFVTAHYSNWELLGQFMAKHGFPMLLIGRKGSNRFIDQKITLPFRNRYGNRAVHKDKAMVTMAKRLKKGESLGMLIDQKTNGTHAVKIPFFGKDASTTLSTASLKLKFDPLVVAIGVVRQKRGKYRFYIGDPVAYTAEEIADEREKLVAMSTLYNKEIESIIKKDPTQWFWMHNRWKA